MRIHVATALLVFLLGLAVGLTRGGIGAVDGSDRFCDLLGAGQYGG